MDTRSLVVILFASLLVLAGSASAQSSDAPRPDESVPDALHGSHSITLGLGLLPQTHVDPGNVRANGFLGSFSYTYWPHSAWGLELSASLLDAEVAAGETTSATSFLLGTNYYPEALAMSSALRPYVMGGFGPYIKWITSSYNASSGTETVMGVRFGAGLDAYVGQRLRLGVRGAYHAVPTYGETVGATRSASGIQMSLEIGVVFGGR